MAFKYRDSGVYEVAHGQIWRVGSHVFVCGDVTTMHFPNVVRGLGVPDLLYTDPPWSDGQAKQFRTLNDLPPPDYAWTEVFKAAIRIPVGARWVVGDRYRTGELAALLDDDHYETWQLPGFSTPRVVGVLHYAGPVPPPDRDFTGIKDQTLPLHILRSYPKPGLVVDTCSGLGITSRCAERAGWRSVNNELSPHRVSAAIRKMEKLIGQTPERVA